VKYARARHSAVTIRGTSVINFRFSIHPWHSLSELPLPRRHLLCVPLVQWLKRHGLCPCCDRQGEHYCEKPHYSFLLANRINAALLDSASCPNKASLSANVARTSDWWRLTW